MNRYFFKKHFLYFFIVLGIFTLLNARESGGYGSISYELMQSICKGKPKLAEGGKPVCECSKVRIDHFSSSEQFSLETLLLGDFTNSGVEEVFTVTSGCEAHVNNWGGSVLFRKNGNKWKKVFYDPGYPGKCKMFRSMAGQSELLCLSEYMNQGYITNSLMQYRVTDNGLREIETLYSGESDEGVLNSKQKNTLVESWQLYDIDHDGHRDIVLLANQSGRGLKKTTYLYRNGSFIQKSYRNSRNRGDDSVEKTFHLNENGIDITLRYPASIRVGQPFLLKATMRNRKANARMGGLTLSFPDLKTIKTKTVQKTFDSVKSYRAPAKLYSSITRSIIRSRYFVLEGWENKWPYDRSKSFVTELTIPEGLDRLHINIRGVLILSKNKRNKREVLSPAKNGRTDQQGYDVKQITIPVRQ